MKRTNKDVREIIESSGLKYWQVATAVFGITDSNFSRKLRSELPEKEKQKIYQFINECKKERKERLNG
ncbi:hypothetical protein F8154_10265 [Alkaliphilus pronyensis]|uniref:XRE family transcriptional regulator n=1 Tax=Alkaliphilus pronyensis TaxID=1482732 RepID=A0A6I0F718_9FIRM|nr:hypothetical protein [Alkaliphilus pronyensis]KAB3533843.1 hypothetical protein F8154_10265 [Alkaliphilus pronyensis]